MDAEGYIGEYTQQLDPKGRVVFPVRFRDTMTERERREGFYLTKWLDGSLALYPYPEWLRVRAKVQRLGKMDPKYRHFVRTFNSKAREIALDGQGRIKIPYVHKEIGSISKEVVFVGMGEYVELWSPEKFNAYEEYHAPDYDKIGEEIFFGPDEVPVEEGASESGAAERGDEDSP